MNPPLVYVIVINWNGIQHVQDCFESLLASEYADARFLLVDNGSSDGSPEYVEKLRVRDSRVEVMRLGDNLGWGPGNNRGIERALAAGADYVFLLNNDTTIDPQALVLLVNAAESNSEAGCLAPKMVMFDAPDVINSLGVTMSYVGCAWDIGVGAREDDGARVPEILLAVCGGAMFLRSEALREAGLIDEKFGIYYDDVDLCLRFRQHGYASVPCPAARVRHKFSATFRDRASARRKHMITERNRLRCLLLNFPATMLAAFLPWVFLGECRVVGSAIRAGEWWRVMAQFSAWMAIAIQLPGILHSRSGRFSTGYNETLWNLINRERMFCPEIPTISPNQQSRRGVA